MISCRNVAHLLLSDQVQSQSRWKRMEVRMHLAMCRFCSRLARQISQMREGARRHVAECAAEEGLEGRLLRSLTGK